MRVSLIFSILLLIAIGCAAKNKTLVKMKTNPPAGGYEEELIFPEKFFFGTASSDFQTTGGNGKTDWDEHIKNYKPPQIGPGIGTDFLNRYQEDFDLAEQIGDQMHRISLEWSRLEPEEGVWNYAALEQYKKMIEDAQKRDIKIMICLNHFTSSLWFSAMGGWENPLAPYYYGRYAEFVARNLGIPLQIEWWLTFNEPQVMLIPSYFKGEWPPYKKLESPDDYQGTNRLIKVAGNILETHRQAYKKIHEVLDEEIPTLMVSFASAPGYFEPFDPKSKNDRIAYNALHTQSLIFDTAVGKDRDFIGLNYYERYRLQASINVIGAMFNSKNNIGIEWVKDTTPYPNGLRRMILEYAKQFPQIPIVITENGIDDEEDALRPKFLIEHLRAVHQAIQAGAPVIGYMHWALTDTWEWNRANFSHFGLIAIDRENNLKRSLRPSAKIYSEIIKTHKISKELYKKYILDK